MTDTGAIHSPELLDLPTELLQTLLLLLNPPSVYAFALTSSAACSIALDDSTWKRRHESRFPVGKAGDEADPYQNSEKQETGHENSAYALEHHLMRYLQQPDEQQPWQDEKRVECCCYADDIRAREHAQRREDRESQDHQIEQDQSSPASQRALPPLYYPTASRESGQ